MRVLKSVTRRNARSERIVYQISRVAYLVCVRSFKAKHRLRNRLYMTDGKMTITSFFVTKKNRGLGIGHKLLSHVINKSKKIGIKIISLDDMSDNFGKPNNIYLKNGFRYVEDGCPEMILSLS